MIKKSVTKKQKKQKNHRNHRNQTNRTNKIYLGKKTKKKYIGEPE